MVAPSRWLAGGNREFRIQNPAFLVYYMNAIYSRPPLLITVKDVFSLFCLRSEWSKRDLLWCCPSATTSRRMLLFSTLQLLVVPSVLRWAGLLQDSAPQSGEKNGVTSLNKLPKFEKILKYQVKKCANWHEWRSSIAKRNAMKSSSVVSIKTLTQYNKRFTAQETQSRVVVTVEEAYSLYNRRSSCKKAPAELGGKVRGNP